MPAAPDRIRLESLPGPALAVALAHVLLGMLVWIVLPLWPGASPRGAADPDLVWLPPESYLVETPKPALPAPEPASPPPPSVRNPPVAPAPAAQATQRSLADRSPLRATNKYITLSPRLPELAGPPSPPKSYRPPSLLDIANRVPKDRDTGANMGAVDAAVQQTYLKEWAAPSAHLVPPGQRSAVVNLSINKDGSIAEAVLVKTGAPALNVSISQLLQRVTKIPVTLPSSFRKPRYDLQVNFQIE